MDDNNLHNDFDDSEIRTSDKYDELGYRRVDGPRSYIDEDGNEVQRTPLPPNIRMLLFIIILVSIIVGPSLIAFISSFKNLKPIDNKVDYSECIQNVGKYIKDTYELNIEYSKVENIKGGKICHVLYELDNTSFDVYYDYDTKNNYDNKNSDKIKDSFSKIVSDELSSHTKIVFKFNKYVLLKEDLFKYNINSTGYDKLFEDYDIYIYSFENINNLKITEFLKNYHIKNLRIINIDSKYENEITDFSNINKVMTYADNSYVFMNNTIKSIAIKHITIDKEFINKYAKDESTDNIYLSIELLNTSDTKVYEETEENNCINYKFNDSASILNMYLYSSNNKKFIYVKVNDKNSYYVHSLNIDNYLSSVGNNIFKICIEK